MRLSRSTLFLPLLPALSCSAGDEPAGEEQPEASELAQPLAPQAGPLPDVGEALVSRTASGVTVIARDAPRLQVLMELAAVAGFAAEPGVGRPAARSLDLELRDVSVEDALSAILEGVPHHRHYDFVSDRDAVREPWSGGRTVLRAVTVGRLPAGERAAAGADAAVTTDPLPPLPMVARGTPATTGAERDREIEDAWQHGDPGRRAEAAALMDPEGDDLPRLIELLGDDPDPLVRATAAEVLADGEGFDTAPALVEALDDPDPRVVAAVIEGLEDLFDDHPDPTIRARVAELREHPDPDVREAVESFEEWVEE